MHRREVLVDVKQKAGVELLGGGASVLRRRTPFRRTRPPPGVCLNLRKSKMRLVIFLIANFSSTTGSSKTTLGYDIYL